MKQSKDHSGIVAAVVFVLIVVGIIALGNHGSSNASSGITSGSSGSASSGVDSSSSGDGSQPGSGDGSVVSGDSSGSGISSSDGGGCTPLSNEGNCYEPGEYCRESDAGASGVAGDGESITCEDNDGLRWEPN